MNPLTCEEVDQRLWRYVDRELPAGNIAVVSSHIEACEPCRGLYHERSREASQYRQAFHDNVFGERFVQTCLSRLKEEGLLDEGGRSRPWKRRFPLRALAAAAALLILVPLVVVLVVFSVRSAPVGSFEVVGVPVNTGRLGEAGELRVQDGDVTRGSCLPGDVFQVPEDSRVDLRWGAADGSPMSMCSVKGPATFWLPPGVERGKLLIWLDRGILEAQVVKLTEGQSFAVDTQHARASVVGTEFRLQASGDRTSLVVREGVVRFESRTWREPTGRGTRLVAPEDGEWIVRKDGAALESLAAGSVDAGKTEAGVPVPADPTHPQGPGEEPQESPVSVDPGVLLPPEFKETLDKPVGKSR